MPEYSEDNPRQIKVKGARVHNLKNIDVGLPRDRFIVITGVSGSGKSSLAFDTLYAEGQRRYVESLSSYARQFLGRIEKPDVDYIHGLPPAIAIEQKVNTRNPRSTVGTSTEVYDYLKLLYSRIGKTHSPISGRIVQRDTVTDVVDYILKFPDNQRLVILSPLKYPKEGKLKDYLKLLANQGTTRLEQNGSFYKIKDILERDTYREEHFKNFNVVIDRIKVKYDEDSKSRIADSVQIAFSEGQGECIIKVFGENEIIRSHSFSNRFELDGISFEEPSENMFSFNNPIGACPECEGYGKIIGIDEDLVVPNKSLSVYDDAIACWRGDKMQKWKNQLIRNAGKFNFPIHKPYSQLSDEQRRLLWTGNRYFHGLNAFFRYLERKKYKIQYRVMLSRYRGKTVCPECNGTRLKKEASYVKVGGKSIPELVLMPIDRLYKFFEQLELDEYDAGIAERILYEIQSRLRFLLDVGLGYLTLNRLSSTLSGGESQRINLATSLGSSLVGSMYILDEPSIGLHPRDNFRLIRVLRRLQKIGNTVIVVEHDEDIIRSADQVIDLGPLAGRLGGELVFQGTPEEIKSMPESYTGQFLLKKEYIEIPEQRRKWNNYIEVKGARENNLKGIDVRFPLNIMTVITGVSGSGKSSLVKNILTPALNRHYKAVGQKAGRYDELTGDLNLMYDVEYVDQNPVGKSSRSNPVTYIKAYDEIRKLFASQQSAKINNLKASHFSFNTPGGRCEECRGEGVIKVEMQFMPDITLTCEACNGMRFKEEVLEVKYRGNNIYEVLEMTINEAIDFFRGDKSAQEDKIARKLSILREVGLGYLKLGQSSSTLSGGESQRVKLASFLGSESQHTPTLFIFDEPTTGLHYYDISRLLESFNKLIQKGHTVVVIEHNMEVIKSADWIIDLGPEGGEAGGNIVCQGKPEEIMQNRQSHTGAYLSEKLKEKAI
ncbi:MAG: excinuclease ABC subunit UvrA [Bacteroidales bacterium]|nr:excinuclease ABC subunit UvrA [Bacteroidales bacterium]